MASKVIPIDPAGEAIVRLDKNEVVFEHFRERDGQVVALAKEADSPEALMHDCLAVGARALTAAQATSDVAVVEKAFGDMTSTFTRELDDFSEELESKSKELLDDEQGMLPRSLQEFRAKLEELLGDTFDPDSKQSAIATLEQVMRK